MFSQRIIGMTALSLVCASIHPNPLTPIPDTAIAQLPCVGVLRENEEGFVYIDIDDRFIHDLVRFIESEGFEAPPYFGPGRIGAHISVICKDEEKYGPIEECGQIFSFTPVACQVVHPPHWTGVEEVYLIEVDVPGLDLIREKYGLPQKEFPFHIAIGVKRKAGFEAQREWFFLDNASEAALCSASFFEAPIPIPASSSPR